MQASNQDPSTSTFPLLSSPNDSPFASTPGSIVLPPPAPPEEATSSSNQQPIIVQVPSNPSQKALPLWSKTIFLASRGRTTGEPNDAFYMLDAGLRCGKSPGERITLTPTYASMMRGWDTVGVHNRRFQLVIDGVETDCFLKVGSGYNCNSFGVQAALSMQKASPGFIVKYDKIANRYTFTPPDDKVYQITMPHRHLNVFFGFKRDTRITMPFGKSNPLVSQVNVSMTPQVSVVIGSDLIITDSVLSNFTHRHICNTGIILVMPIDCAPYSELGYQAATPDTGTLTLASNNVHHIRIFVGDESGLPIDVSDWVLGLRFDVYGPISKDGSA
jgi:hypothetical protein